MFGSIRSPSLGMFLSGKCRNPDPDFKSLKWRHHLTSHKGPHVLAESALGDTTMKRTNYLTLRLKTILVDWERMMSALPLDYFRALQQRAFLNFTRNSKKKETN